MLAARLLRVWSWAELSVRQYLEENPAAARCDETSSMSADALLHDVSEDEVAAFTLDVVREGLRARLREPLRRRGPGASKTTTGPAEGDVGCRW